MGAYVSKDECPSYIGQEINCVRGWTIQDGKNVTTKIGNNERGQVEPDGDIAGIGVITAFIAVTSLALAFSIVDVLWTIYKVRTRRPQRTYANSRWPTWSFSGLLETIILSCSDQQVFTGGAYAITLRYYKGCSITAYHYNVVANIMLLTCATHLMTVTIVRDYFKLPAVSFIRILLITLLMIVTGLLLSNQNAKGAKFPTTIPETGDETAAMFFPAACFQDKNSQFGLTWGQTFNTAANFGKTIITSTPGDNTIHGWNLYIIIVIFYVVSLIIESVRFIRRGLGKEGRRQRLVQRAKTFACCGCLSSKGARILGHAFLCIYMLGGAGFCTFVVVDSSRFIMTLRSWAKYSGWLKMDEETKDSSEDELYAFGQLVPMLLILLTVFAFIAKLNEMFQESRMGRRLTLSGNLTPHSSQMLSPAGPSRVNSYNAEKLLATQSNGTGNGNGNHAVSSPWPLAQTSSYAAPGTPGTAGFAGNGSIVMVANLGTPGTVVSGQSPHAASVIRFENANGATPLTFQSGYFDQQPHQQSPQQQQQNANGGAVAVSPPPDLEAQQWSLPLQPQAFQTTPTPNPQVIVVDNSTPLTQDHGVMAPTAETHSNAPSPTPGVAGWSTTNQQQGTPQQGQYQQYQQ